MQGPNKGLARAVPRPSRLPRYWRRRLRPIHRRGFRPLAAVAFVQSAHNAASGVSSLAKLFTSNNAAGNCLICCVGVWKSTTFNDPTISDSKGNTWKLLLATPRQVVSGVSGAYLFVAYNCASGPNTVTLSVGTSSDIDIAIHEYSGVATVTAHDQMTAASDRTTTSVLTGTIRTQFANEVVFSFAYDQTHGTQTFTPTSGWNGREQTVNPGAESLRSYDQIASSTGSFSNTVTISAGNSNGLHAIIASFADTSTTDKLVQLKANSGVSVSTLGAAFPAANAAGNLLLLAIGRWSSTTLGTISSVTDTQGNTWVLVGPTTLLSPATHGQSQAHLYACASCAAGANTVTVATSSAQDDLRIVALEYLPNTISGFIANSSIVNAPLASGNLAIDAGLAFTLAYDQSNNKGTYSDFSGTGWRERFTLGGTGGETLSVYDQVAASPATLEQTISVPSVSLGLHVILAAKAQSIRPIMEFLIS
jgi:hypothetical protein